MKPVIWVAFLALSATVHGDVADLVFTGDHIVAMDGTNPTAVAVTGERIVWTGDRDAVDPWVGPHTTVRNLGDRALLPGFIDAHGHLSFLAQTVAMANVSAPPVGAVDDIAALQRVLREHIRDKAIAAGAWVVGMGYDDSLLREQRHPTRTDLDAVADDRPIVLIHVSGHLMSANSLALRTAGIDATTLDPAGGHIRRRAGTTEPDGVLEETATFPLRAQLETLASEPDAGILSALDVYARNGITTVQDGAASAQQITTLTRLDDAGRLSLDVVAYPVAMAPDVALPARERFGHYGKRLKIGGVKLILDGSPQGKTAYLGKSYHVPPQNADASYRGYPILPASAVDALIARYLGDGIQVLAHANGDAAADLLIDAVAAAKIERDHRTVMIHAQTVREDQLDRMAALGIVPSYFSAHTFFWGDWHRDSVLGPERAARISPMRSTVSRGMHFTVHNDSPIVPPDMIRLLWASTNRQTRSGAVLGAEQRLTVMEALNAMTLDAAYQQFEERDKGSITAGKLADLVILSEDPRALDPARLLELAVFETISRGRTVFALPPVPAIP